MNSIPSVKVSIKSAQSQKQFQDPQLNTPKKEQHLINLDLQSSQRQISKFNAVINNNEVNSIKTSQQMRTPSFQNTIQKNIQNSAASSDQKLSEIKQSYVKKDSVMLKNQQQLDLDQNYQQIESANLSAIMMPQNQSHTNINDDESITHTFIRENQSLLQVIPSAYTTQERQQNDSFQAGIINNKNQGLISNDSYENLQQKLIGSARIQVYGQHAQDQNKRSRQQFTKRKNPCSDSMISLNNDNNKSLGKNGKSRSLSQVSITLKENTKANQGKVQQTIPLQLNSYRSQNLNEKPQQIIDNSFQLNYKKAILRYYIIINESHEVQQDQQVNISQLLQMNFDLRNEFEYFKSETNERISELEMKHLNQQEIIDYLLQLLQGQGVNVFNKQDLKDDSIKDSIQIRKEKLQILKNEQVLGQDSQNAHSGSENDQQNQKNEAENLYYFSQDEMFKHNETSNYEDARIRNVSEPDIVNRMPLDDEDDQDNAQNDEHHQNSDNSTQSQMSPKEQTTQSNMNLMINCIGMGVDSDQDEVQIQQTNFDYNYMTNDQDEQQQNVLTPLSQNQQFQVNQQKQKYQRINKLVGRKFSAPFASFLSQNLFFIICLQSHQKLVDPKFNYHPNILNKFFQNVYFKVQIYSLSYYMIKTMLKQLFLINNKISFHYILNSLSRQI